MYLQELTSRCSAKPMFRTPESVAQQRERRIKESAAVEERLIEITTKQDFYDQLDRGNY